MFSDDDLVTLAFADAVDWVGLDSYPGTWAPQIALSSLLPGLAAIAVKDSVRALRNCYLPMAGLGASTALHIADGRETDHGIVSSPLGSSAGATVTRLSTATSSAGGAARGLLAGAGSVCGGRCRQRITA